MEGLPSNRWGMFKKLIIFQVKLALDAVRDLFLSPISFIFALIDIINNKTDEHSYFHKLMFLGGKTDVWLNLFSQHDSETKTDSNKVSKSEVSTENNFTENNADHLFNKIEDLLREQHAKGGLTASAKNKIDTVLQKVTANKEENQSSEDPKNKNL
jgi:hypothetical protein